MQATEQLNYNIHTESCKINKNKKKLTFIRLFYLVIFLSWFNCKTCIGI